MTLAAALIPVMLRFSHLSTPILIEPCITHGALLRLIQNEIQSRSPHLMEDFTFKGLEILCDQTAGSDAFLPSSPLDQYATLFLLRMRQGRGALCLRIAHVKGAAMRLV